MHLWFLFLLVAAPAFGARVVCYWNGKSFWREGTAKVTADDIKIGASMCTHLIYGFAAIDDDDFNIEPIDKKLDLDKGKGQWRAVTALKRVQPGLSVLLSVGGNEDTKDIEKYFEVLEEPNRRSKFISTVAAVLREFGFDGVDLAWQFPEQHEKYEKTSVASIWHKIKKTFGAGVDSKAIEHRDQFVSLCRELKAQLRNDGKLLSIGLLPHVNSTTYMDVRSLMPYVDMVNLWTVDFRTPVRSPEKADYVHPLEFAYPRKPHQNVEAVVRHWLDHGAESYKLNLGIATWGRSWKLTEDSGLSGTPPIDKVDGPGMKGPHTKTDGILSYYEVCIKLVNPANPVASAGMLRKITDPERKMGAYGFRLPDRRAGETVGMWVGFEEPETAAVKASFAKRLGLGGVAILDLALDDSKGFCDGNKYPITRAVKLNLDNMGYAVPALPAYPAQPSYGGGVPPQQPSYGGVPPQQPSYGGVPPQQPSYGGVQPTYGGNVQQPGYGGVQPQSGYSGVPPQQPSYGGVPPQQPSYGGVQPQPGYSGNIQQPAYGGNIQQPGFSGVPQQQPGYGGVPQQQPGYGGVPPQQPSYHIPPPPPPPPPGFIHGGNRTSITYTPSNYGTG